MKHQVTESTPQQRWRQNGIDVRRDAMRRLRPEQIVARLAERIIDRATHGACTEDDLEALGFDRAVVARHLPAAKAEARRIAPQLQGGL